MACVGADPFSSPYERRERADGNLKCDDQKKPKLKADSVFRYLPYRISASECSKAPRFGAGIAPNFTGHPRAHKIRHFIHQTERRPVQILVHHARP